MYEVLLCKNNATKYELTKNWKSTNSRNDILYLDMKLGISSSFMPDTKYGAESHIF